MRWVIRRTLRLVLGYIDLPFACQGLGMGSTAGAELMIGQKNRRVRL